MNYKRTLHIPKEEVEKYQKILNRKSCDPDYPEDSVIKTFTTTFSNGYQVDIKVCNSYNDNQYEEKSSPFVDPVLFEPAVEGCSREVVIGEVSDTLLGEYIFWDDSHNDTYTVLVIED